MSKKVIPEEVRKQAIRLYRNKNLTIQEISNLVDVSKPKLDIIFRECFDSGELKPRAEALRYVDKKPKFTPETMREIAEDYYVNGLSVAQIREKWGVHPMQMQRIRDLFGARYGKKPPVGRRPVVQFDKFGNQIAEFPSTMQASKSTEVAQPSIVSCCVGRLKSAGGFVWKYKELSNDNRTE